MLSAGSAAFTPARGGPADPPRPAGSTPTLCLRFEIKDGEGASSLLAAGAEPGRDSAVASPADCGHTRTSPAGQPAAKAAKMLGAEPAGVGGVHASSTHRLVTGVASDGSQRDEM